MHYTRISADCHIDMPWLPPDLFTANASAAMKDRMPYVVEGPDGPHWTTKKGRAVRARRRDRARRKKYVPGQNHRVDVMAATGLYDDGKKGIRRPTDPTCASRTWTATASRPRCSSASSAPRRAWATTRPPARCSASTTTGWSTSAGTTPTRHIGLACLPYGDIDAAVKEVHRVAQLGLRGLELSCSWDMEPMWHPMWEPLWQAVNDVNLPLHFHTFPSLPPGRARPPDGPHPPGRVLHERAGFQMNLVNILAAVIGAAVLERYPNIRISFGESGIGWIPYALDRMDFEWEDRFRDLGLTMKPSDYWRRQCKATFQFDQIGTKLIDDMGVETLMWGSDYPHPDGVWPDRRKYIEEQFGHLPADVVHKITCENAGKFYGLMS